MDLVENENAPGQPVDLAAAACSAGKETFEELHRSRHNDGSVPVLRREIVHVRLPLRVDVGMMLDDFVPSQDIAKHAGVLFNDRGERDHDDDPAKPVRYGMVECKSHRGERLSPAGRGGQREHPRFVGAGSTTVGEDLGTDCVDRRKRLAKPSQMPVEPGLKLRQLG
ncbi:MAG TPA: hypothetical protein VGL03_12845 [Thermoanaerobaculia bacterium]